MKIDGKELAKKAARMKIQKDDEKSGKEHMRVQELEGSHISEMASFIEAIHDHNADKAHSHMVAYAKKLSDINNGTDKGN